MKIIVSHDVDHLYLSEHWKDRFLPGLMIRTVKDLRSGNVQIKGAINRFSYRLNRIRELVEFNENIGVTSNFFFGMANGLGLSYHSEKARPFIEHLVSKNIFVGLHGMAYDNKEALLNESKLLEEILGYKPEGIRNHYLRQSESTKRIMAEVGFKFDSTDRGLINPSMIDGIYSFPISIMDVDVIKPGCHYNKIWEDTLSIVQNAKLNSLECFVINFHDVYFSSVAYPIHYKWYINLIKYLKSEGCEFGNFIK